MRAGPRRRDATAEVVAITATTTPRARHRRQVRAAAGRDAVGKRQDRAPIAGPDAELFALMAQHGAAQAVAVAADRGLDAARTTMAEQHPPRPAALRWRGRDRFGFCPEEREEMPGGALVWFYAAADVERLRRAPAPTTREWRGTPEQRTARDPAGWQDVPDPRRAARLEEIIAAHDRWTAEVAALAERVGIARAEAKADAAAQALDGLARCIVETPARTLAGLTAKARWILKAGRLDRDAGALCREVGAFDPVRP